jgi:hypothetical protein
MSERYPGGIITKSPATPTGPYQTGAAPGIWTLDQQLQYQQQGVWPTAGLSPNYIEDVFSTYLYTGTGAAQTITNGIDLSTKGGLVWLKERNNARSHFLQDSARTITSYLSSDNTDAASSGTAVTALNTTGFTLGTQSGSNGSGNTYASWTFRKQPKFFDVVTYTGNGIDDTQIAHSLGSTPGCVMIKRTDTTGAWAVSHNYDFGNVLFLNTTAAAIANPASNGYFGYPANPLQSTYFTLGTNAATNASGGTYIAYIFAHDSGGFGLAGTDNVISCGSFTADASGNASVSLGYEPQWVLFKATTSTQQWFILDNMRGFYTSVPSGPDARQLIPNATNAESGYGQVGPTATGFNTTEGQFGASETYIYVAIRRGPMKVPTLGTSVFSPVTYSGDGSTGTVRSFTAGFPIDMQMLTNTNFGQVTGSASSTKNTISRLTSLVTVPTIGVSTRGLFTSATTAETNISGYVAFYQTTFGIHGTSGGLNDASANYVTWNFRRAPSFFDEVCWTAPGGTNTLNHNLTVIPELIITKKRINVTSSGAAGWIVMSSAYPGGFISGGLTSFGQLQSSAAIGIGAGGFLQSIPTSTTFTLLGSNYQATDSFVAYLFATCAGVSKVGSYTGTGTTQTINCGFTGGARFVMIKRTDSTGDWYVWDSARGIIAGDDPYLLLNSTAAEEPNTDYIDTAATGFEISSTAPAAINASAGTFIFLAIA